MIVSYHKVIKQITQNTDIKLITRDIDNTKHIFTVKGFSPYCFISEANEYLLEDNQYVSRKFDDGFRNFWDGSPMITAIFHHPANVGLERKRIGDEILHQADVHYELACTVMKNIGRYIRIEGDVRTSDLYVDRIYPMNQYEIESMKFPDYHLIFLDIEVLGDPFEFPNAYEADKEIVSIVTSDINGKTDIWFFGDPTVKTVRNKLLGMSGKVHSFPTEQSTIMACFEHCYLYDVGLAWNSKFDEEYLINRSKKLGLNCDWRTIQWFNLQQSVAMAQEFATDYLALKMIFDDIYMYKRHAWKYLPEIFQDYFTEEEGKSVEDRGKGMATLNKESLIYKYIQFRKGQSGADVKELYESKKFKELMFYNACDVWDMLMLTKVATIDSYFRLFDGLELLRLNDLFYHTTRIEPLALKFCMINKVASPSRLIQEGKIEEGAIVHNPTQGRVLENVIVLDFSRFYISIILAKEFSPENQGENPKKLFYKMPNGDSFDEPMFFLPALAKYLIDQRNYADKKVLESDDIITKEYWNSQARSLKTITSGLWGYIAQNGKIRDEKTNEILPQEKQRKAGRYYAEHVPNEILQESRNKTMELKEYILETPINEVQYDVVYGDSVVGETPILYKNDGSIFIDEIQNLWRKDIEFKVYKVYTERGWTKINKILRHKTKKEIFGVLTHTGYVEITEDHSLLKRNSFGQFVKTQPNDVNIGDSLLHAFPSIENNYDNISLDESYLFGFFMADGSCGFYKGKRGKQRGYWTLNNSDKDLMIKLQEIIKKVYKRDSKILDTMKSSSVYKLTIMSNTLTSIYTDLMYCNKRKKVPDIVLNSNLKIKQAFFDGFYAGDGDRKSGNIRISQYGQIGCAGLYFIMKALGYNVSINSRKDKHGVLRLNGTKRSQRYNPHTIKKIKSIGLKDDYVYDLETENHHFHAGVGELIVHNTDATFLESKTHTDFREINPEIVSEYVNVFFEQLCKDQGYPYPILVKAEKMYDKLVLVSKKFYYGRIVWEDGKFLETPKFDVKGMQAKRSDHSQLAKDFQYSIIQNHLAEGDTGIRKTVQRMNKKTSEGLQEKGDNFLESISLPWKVKKPLKKYKKGVWKYWSASAKLWNEYVRLNNLGIENQIKQNDKVFIMLIKHCGIRGLSIKNQYLVFPRASLVDWSKVEIDRFAMEEKTVKEKITNILTSLGWEPQRIRSMSKGRSTQRARF